MLVLSIGRLPPALFQGRNIFCTTALWFVCSVFILPVVDRAVARPFVYKRFGFSKIKAGLNASVSAIHILFNCGNTD